MRIVVLIKQVPRDMCVSLNKDYTIDREAMQKIMNPADMSALATASGLKKQYGGEIVGITMGPKSAAECLREAAVSGADELYHICDTAFAASDTFVTAKILAAAIRFTGGADIILCGRHTIDGETGQVGPEISIMLGASCVTNVLAITQVDSDKLICSRLTEIETQVFSAKLPAVISVCEFCVTPTLPTVAMMRRAASMPINLLTAKELDLAGMTGREDSPTRVERVYIKERERRKVVLLPVDEGIQKIREIINGGKGCCE